MEELETNEELNIYLSLENTTNNATENISDNLNTENSSTVEIEYKELDEPCVALTITGENQPTAAEVFVKRGIKYSIKAFFSAIVLTIMNMFI